MAEDSVEERVEELEQRIENLEERVNVYRNQYALLAAEADVEALPNPNCPECGDGSLKQHSGMTWAKAVCTSCDAYWYLHGGDN
jgi:hypothetical protein